MGTRITLTLPDTVYQQAQAAAQLAQRPVPDVLTEALEQAFPAVYVSPDRASMEQEQVAFDHLHPELLATHEGLYVAIHGGQVVDADSDEMALAVRVISAYPEQVVHIRQVVREPELELRMRSPRYID